MTDPTNAARQARHRKARALGYEHVAGYLPPKRAAKVRQWLVEAEPKTEGGYEMAFLVKGDHDGLPRYYQGQTGYTTTAATAYKFPNRESALHTADIIERSGFLKNVEVVEAQPFR